MKEAKPKAARASPQNINSEYFFRTEEGAYGAEVGDAEDPEVLIFTADVAERKFAVADADAAAGTVVADLGNLVLKLMLGEVVAGAEGRVPTATGEIAVADERA